MSGVFGDITGSNDVNNDDDMEVLQLLLGECIEEVCNRVTNASRQEFLSDHVPVEDLKMRSSATIEQQTTTTHSSIIPSATLTPVVKPQVTPTDTGDLGDDVLRPQPPPQQPPTPQQPSAAVIQHANDDEDVTCTVCYKQSHCRICEISFSSDVQHEEHNEGRRHRQEVQRRIEDAETTLPPIKRPFVCTVCSRNYYCQLCNKPFCSELQMDDHLAGKKHRLALKQQRQSDHNNGHHKRRNITPPRRSRGGGGGGGGGGHINNASHNNSPNKQRYRPKQQQQQQRYQPVQQPPQQQQQQQAPLPSYGFVCELCSVRMQTQQQFQEHVRSQQHLMLEQQMMMNSAQYPPQYGYFVAPPSPLQQPQQPQHSFPPLYPGVYSPTLQPMMMQPPMIPPLSPGGPGYSPVYSPAYSPYNSPNAVRKKPLIETTPSKSNPTIIEQVRRKLEHVKLKRREPKTTPAATTAVEGDGTDAVRTDDNGNYTTTTAAAADVTPSDTAAAATTATTK